MAVAPLSCSGARCTSSRGARLEGPRSHWRGDLAPLWPSTPQTARHCAMWRSGSGSLGAGCR
eukprot:9485327-Pyramimonas_sp.AAC.1